MGTSSSRFLAASALIIAASGVSGCSSPAAPQDTGGSETASASGTAQPVTIYLTRHGETMLNVLERAQGWSDSPLTDEGEKIATAVGKGLKGKVGALDAVYSADMVRHFDTATLMAAEIDPALSVTRDERLRELAFGGFEGGPGEELFEVAAKQLKAASVDEMLMQYTLPEITDAVAAANPNPDLPAEGCTLAGPRMQQSIDAIAKGAEGKGQTKVLAVSSGMSIACLLAELGAELPDGPIENGAVNELVYQDGEWTVNSVNDTSYAG